PAATSSVSTRNSGSTKPKPSLPGGLLLVCVVPLLGPVASAARAAALPFLPSWSSFALLCGGSTVVAAPAGPPPPAPPPGLAGRSPPAPGTFSVYWSIPEFPGGRFCAQALATTRPCSASTAVTIQISLRIAYTYVPKARGLTHEVSFFRSRAYSFM